MIALDVRSLIVFRICFGLYLLYDIWMIRLSSLSSFIVASLWKEIWTVTTIVTAIAKIVFNDPTIGTGTGTGSTDSSTNATVMVPVVPVVDYDIGWYTAISSVSSSSSSTPIAMQSSYFQSQDTPHSSFIHQIWFYRTTSIVYQYILFIITSVLAILYIFGQFEGTKQKQPSSSSQYSTTSIRFWNDTTTTTTKKTINSIDPYDTTTSSDNSSTSTSSIVYKLCLWLCVVSYQHQNMYVHDGSDTYTRLLLLYTCFIPLSSSSSSSSNNNMKRHGSSKSRSSKSRIDSIASETMGSAVVSGISIISIALQIVCMYCGTICRRTVDLVNTTTTTTTTTAIPIPISQIEWLPPTLSAVYHALCLNHFAVRNNYLNHMICSYYPLTQIMTMCAMMIETFCPIIGFCLLLFIYQYRNNHNKDDSNNNNIRQCRRVLVLERLLWYLSIVPLMTLHLGLLCSLRLPNWQIIALIALILWIPSTIWNTIERYCYTIRIMRTPVTQLCFLQRKKEFNTDPHNKDNLSCYKKTDGDDDDDENNNNDRSVVTAITANDNVMDKSYSTTMKTANTIRKTSTTKGVVHLRSSSSVSSSHIIITIVQYFLLLHMIYNFSNERSIISKYDAGDIGEFFRISQYWVMYSTVGTTAHTTQMTGTIHVDMVIDNNNVTVTKSMDVLHFISTTGKMIDPKPSCGSTGTTNSMVIPNNVSMMASIPCLETSFPSVRWERALNTLSKDSYQFRNMNNVRRIQQQEQRLRYFGTALCRLMNMDLSYQIQQQQPKVHANTPTQRRQERNIRWMIRNNDTNRMESVLINDQTIHTTTNDIYLSEIEIRFQHLQFLPNKHMLQQVSSDIVMTVPCPDRMNEM